MQAIDDLLVCVQCEWDGWRTAEVRLVDLQNLHWLQPERAPRPLVHGYVSCACIIAGGLSHECDRTEGPHTLLVCVLKKHVVPSGLRRNCQARRRAGLLGFYRSIRGSGIPRTVQAPRMIHRGISTPSGRLR